MIIAAIACGVSLIGVGQGLAYGDYGYALAWLSSAGWSFIAFRVQRKNKI